MLCCAPRALDTRPNTTRPAKRFANAGFHQHGIRGWPCRFSIPGAFMEIRLAPRLEGCEQSAAVNRVSCSRLIRVDRHQAPVRNGALETGVAAERVRVTCVFWPRGSPLK